MTVIWAHRPETPVTEFLEWKTDIVTSRSGKERRHAVRARPRQRLELTYLLDDDEVRQLRWQLYQRGSEQWQIPSWNNRFHTNASSPSGAANVFMDTSTCDIVAGDVVFIVNESTYLVRTVDSVLADRLVLTSNLTSTFPVGSEVMLQANALLSEGQGARRYAVNLSEVRLVADVETFRSPAVSSAVLTEYRGLPVLDRRPLSPDLTNEEYFQGVERIDFSSGVFENALGWDIGRASYARDYYLGSRSEINWFRSLVAEQVGMREPLWFPTWRGDFSTGAGNKAGLSSVFLGVVGTTPTASAVGDWFAEESEPHVMFEDDDGEMILRKVTSVADIGGGFYTCGLDSSLPAGTPITSETAAVLHFGRLGGDQVKIEHHGVFSIGSLVLRTLDEEATLWILAGTRAAAAVLYSPTVALVGGAQAVTGGTAATTALAPPTAAYRVVGGTKAGTSLGAPTAAYRVAGATIAGTTLYAAHVANYGDFFVKLPADDSVTSATFSNIDGLALSVATNTNYLFWGFSYFDASDADVTSGMQFDGPASKVWFVAHFGFPGAFNRWPFDYNSGTGAAGFTGRNVAQFKGILETGGTSGTLQYKTRSTDGTDTVTYPRGSWIAARTGGGLVELAADVTNSGASSGTLADIDAGGGDALKLALTSGVLYWYRFWLTWSATATTTGYVLAVNGPAATRAVNQTQIKIASNSQVRGSQNGYNATTPAGTDSVAGGNFAYMEGVVLPSASGDLIARHAAEANSLSVTAEAGSMADMYALVAGDPNVGIASGDVSDTTEVLVDITDCKVWVEANQEIAFEVRIPYVTNNNATGIGVGLNGPSSPTEFEAEVRIGNSGTAITVGRLGAYGDRVDSANSTSGNDRLVIITGYLRNGSTAGYLQVQFAREAGAGAGTVTAYGQAAIMKRPLV